MKKEDDLNYKVYWEKQGMDSLCGVHCINSLLQGTRSSSIGPFFDEIALSHIAL
jgi:ataxin-3